MKEQPSQSEEESSRGYQVGDCIAGMGGKRNSLSGVPNAKGKRRAEEAKGCLLHASNKIIISSCHI